MQDIFSKRSFWAALAFIFLVVIIVRYLKIDRSKERVKEEVKGIISAIAPETTCPNIAIVSPKDGLLLIYVDDILPDEKGYQVRVMVETDAGDGREVSLNVNDEIPLKVPVEKGLAFFAKVNLKEGPNTIIAYVTGEGGCTSKSKPVRNVVDILPPHIDIKTPVDGAILGVVDVTVKGKAWDEGKGLDVVMVNGIIAKVKEKDFEATLYGQPKGPLTITAFARDQVGQITAETINISISFKPFVNLNSPEKEESVNTRHLEVSGNFGNFPRPDRVRVVVNGRQAEIEGQQYQIAFDGLPDGEYTFRAVATDGVHSANAIRKVMIDTRPPSIIITEPLDNAIISLYPIVIKGLVKDRRPGSGIESVTINGIEASLSDGKFTFTMSGFGFCLDPLEIKGEAKDKAGNISDSEVIEVIVDIQPPAIEITSPPGQAPLKTTRVGVRGSVVDTCSGVNSVMVNGVLASLMGEEFTATILADACSNPLNINAVAIDRAGNQGNSLPVYVIVDNEPPVLSIESPPEGANVSNSFDIRGTAVDDCTEVVSVTVNEKAASYGLATGSFTAELKEQDDGSLELKASAKDRCGNISSYSHLVKVSPLNPQVNIIAPQNNEIFTTDRVEVTGMFNGFPDPGAVRVSIGVGEGEGIPATVNGERYSALLVLPQGSTINIKVGATDGTREASLATVRVMVDSVPPEIEITSPVEGELTRSSDIVVTGTAFDAISGIKSVEIQPGNVLASLLANNTWAATLEDQIPGSIRIQATAIDAVGLSNSSSVNIAQCHPPLLAPGGSGCYGTMNTNNGTITYNCNDFDFGVPVVGMIGLGRTVCVRPGERITLPVNLNAGDWIIEAWELLIDYDKEVLTNARITGCDRNLPQHFLFYRCRKAPTHNPLTINDPGIPVHFGAGYVSNAEPTGQRNVANIQFTVSDLAVPGRFYPIYTEVTEFYTTPREGTLERRPVEPIPIDGSVLVVE